MLKTIYQQNTFTIGLLLGLALFTSLVLFFTPNAHATSAYDNTLVTTSSLQYNDSNEGVIDISETWRTRLHSACGSTIYNDFRRSLDGGAWAVSQDGTDDDYGVTVVWSKPDQTIPDSSFYTTYVFNPPLKYFAVDPGWQGKARFHFNSTSDTDICDYSTVAINNPYGSTLTREDWQQTPLGLYASTYEANTPSGYEGDNVPNSTEIEPVTGNVQCANTNNVISAIHINVQSGLDGNAEITDDGAGGKDYRLYLSENSPYSLIVLCDGDPFYGPTVTTNLYDSYNWVCTRTGDLNICAAS